MLRKWFANKGKKTFITTSKSLQRAYMLRYAPLFLIKGRYIYSMVLIKSIRKEEKMSKYEIVKLGMDNYELKYKDKVIKFNSKVNYVNDMQETLKTARLNMVKDLAKEGKTIKSLIIEEVKDGKKYIDNSNKEFLEEAYIQEAQNTAFQKVIEKMLGMNIVDLALDMDLTTEEEVNEFSTQLGEIITGRFSGTGKENKQ